MELKSNFNSGEKIPDKYCCRAGVSPPLEISGVPAGVKSFVLIVDDPDAPSGDWVHWVVWNIPATTRNIAENSAGATPGTQGKNDFGKNNYGGPCPPSGVHRYFFRLYALDTELELGTGSGKADVEKAIKGRVVEKAELMGTYSKQ